jgi:multidrug transporter EmrE-like cation transporter
MLLCGGFAISRWTDPKCTKKFYNIACEVKMNVNLLLLILGSVTLSALAQILLKLGMSNASIQRSLSSGDWFDGLGAAALNLQVIGGLALYTLGAVVWLLVLARVDVSVAYPFVGLGFILTMLLGWLLLQEPVGLTRVIGTALVVLGVYLVAKS